MMCLGIMLTAGGEHVPSHKSTAHTLYNTVGIDKRTLLYICSSCAAECGWPRCSIKSSETRVSSNWG